MDKVQDLIYLLVQSKLLLASKKKTLRNKNKIFSEGLKNS